MKRSLSEMQQEKPSEPFVLEDIGPDGAKVDVELVNPKDLHWTKLTELDELPPAQQIEALIPDAEQYQAFRDDPRMNARALEWVMNEWRTHFGLGGPGDSSASTGS